MEGYPVLYDEIIENERKQAWGKWDDRICDASSVYGTARQMLEIAISSTIRRSYFSVYSNWINRVSQESIGAHTNLMISIVDRALEFIYFSKSRYPRFSYREIIEAARRHDLPENILGDIPDDGTRNDAELMIAESEYWRDFGEFSSPISSISEDNVRILLYEMGARSSELGKLLYLSDKLSAIITVLAYDNIGLTLEQRANSRKASEFDKLAIFHCGYKRADRVKTSEIWTNLYFNHRRQVDNDETGFFTAILVMTTLIVNGKWYDWRFKDYE